MANSQKKSNFSFDLKSIFSKFKGRENKLYSLLLLLGFLMTLLPFDDAFISKFSLASSLFALFVAWLAYKLQKKSDQDLKKMEGNLDILRAEAEKIQEEGKKTQDHVNNAYFLIERTTALNKYPEGERFKEINQSYQPFIFYLFDNTEYNISIQIKENSYLDYKIKPVKNEINIPKKTKVLEDNFYIITIVAPSCAEVLQEDILKQYERSPIKEGEYYSCRFDESRCSWILSQWPDVGFEVGRGFFKFHPSGHESEAVISSSVNAIMGFSKNQYPSAAYKKIDRFIIDQNGRFPAKSGSLFRLFKKGEQVVYSINDSPLKAIYILKTWIDTQPKKSLVFENLRGHIKSEEFIQNLKNRIIQKIGLKNFPERTVDSENDRKNHHIKIPLNNDK